MVIFVTLGNGMSVEELGNILQSVMPQRDQDMRNLTDNLISMKDQEISRLEQNKREQAATISRLKGKIFMYIKLLTCYVTTHFGVQRTFGSNFEPKVH
jgi:hypothetical protein